MKKVLFLSLALCLVLGLRAENVSPDEARQKAAQFLKAKGKTISSPSALAFKAQRKSTKGSKLAKNTASYYVFNADNGGFAIVSGDTRTEEILGYSDRGSFDAQHIPAPLKAWLTTYSDEIQRLDAGKLTAPARATRATNNATKTPIQPLIRTTWAQTSPYNNNVPQINGTPAHAGYIAVAMAQVMNYHKFPDATKAKIETYKTSRQRLKVEEIPAGTAIDWNNILNTYRGNETETQKAAVATLVKACGASIRTDYTADGISGNGEAGKPRMQNVCDVLTKTFGYASTARHILRTTMTAQEWADTIYNELKAGRPVIYAAQMYAGYKVDGGHAFVCDGYDGDGLFHVNWGWGGNADGYYRLPILNPTSALGDGARKSVDGYTMVHEIVTGIQKSQEEIVPTAFEITSWEVKETTLKASLSNKSNKILNTELAFAVLGKDGSLSIIENSIIAARDYRPDYLDILTLEADKLNLEDGQHTIVPVSRTTGSETWNICIGKKSAIAVVAGNEKKFYVPQPKIEMVGEPVMPGSRLWQTNQEVRITLKNTGTGEFNQKVSLFFKTFQNNWQAIHYLQVVLQPGETATFPFYVEAMASKSIYLNLGSGHNHNLFRVGLSDTDYYKEFSLPFTEEEGWNWTFDKITVAHADQEFTLSNPVELTVYGDVLEGALTITNINDRPYHSQLLFDLYDAATDKLAARLTYTPTEIAAKSTGSTPFKAIGIKPGRYYISFTQNIHEGTPTGKCYITVKEGIDLTKADNSHYAINGEGTVAVPNDAVVADFRGKTVSDVTPNNNPNTLYLFDHNAATPTGLVGKNVVKGDVAESVTLIDGHDFLAPLSFTANKIAYKRTVDKGADGGKGGWETLVLPFAATSIQIEGENNELPWLKVPHDEGRFWLKECTGVEDDVVYYQNLQTFQANHPYIVAFPNEKMGSENNLKGKTIVFAAENAAIVAQSLQNIITSKYLFHGNTVSETLKEAYVLNETGDKFERHINGTIAPFRACFQALDNKAQAPVQHLHIAYGRPTALAPQPLNADSEVDIYSLSGQQLYRVARQQLSRLLETLPAGIYIVDGKKVIR